MENILNTLDEIIKNRKSEMPAGAYTTTLFKSGLDRILRKIGEESGELIIAAKNNDPVETANEAADLIFHVMVMLHHQGLSLKSIEDVLKARHQERQS
jgi:phosphoribosyl-ATP pyrophosphohydrolase/phosphoribosyl-AMP cyclohydrolase